MKYKLNYNIDAKSQGTLKEFEIGDFEKAELELIKVANEAKNYFEFENWILFSISLYDDDEYIETLKEIEIEVK